MPNIASEQPPRSEAVKKPRIHWHVVLTHFPISLFGAAFGFQILHLFLAPACFELATNVVLLAGAGMLLPTIATGWLEWKTHYHGGRGLIFRRKIATAIGMTALSLALVVWRIAVLGFFKEAPGSPEHWIFLAGTALLILGALREGYYGGRLSHR